MNPQPVPGGIDPLDVDSGVIAAAELVMEAFATRRSIPPLTDADPSIDEARAYAIAAEIRRRRVARGEVPVGRKIGFTNREIWSQYDVWAPIWGSVYDSTLLDAPTGEARLSLAALMQPRIEPEVQLHFARTPPQTRDEVAILECIDWIAHGFEIVQCPYPGWRFTAADTIAALGLHGALVVGRPVPVEDPDDCAARLRAFTVTLACEGEVRATGGGANVLGSPLLALAHLVEVLAGQADGHPVAAGEIVTTGTLTAALAVAPGETWRTTLDGIDLPGLSVTFS